MVYIYHKSWTPSIKGVSLSFIKRSLQETVISYLWNCPESPDIWLARHDDNMSVCIYMSTCNLIEIKHLLYLSLANTKSSKKNADMYDKRWLQKKGLATGHQRPLLTNCCSLGDTSSTSWFYLKGSWHSLTWGTCL